MNEVSLSKQKFSVAIQTPSIQGLINNTLGDAKRAQRFTASISSVVATNPALQDCDAFSLINAALVGEALELPPTPQLGYFYMVPFQEKKYNPETKQRELVRTVATFILGYRGYLQLAIRSGLYADIDAYEVKEGEYLGKDSQTGKPLFRFINSEKDRMNLKTVGYIAYLELTTGFKKVIYWDYETMLTHADKYSAAFSAVSYELLKEGKVPEKEKYKYSSFWYSDFDGMARKTMLRQLISKWGIMSVELQNAFVNDATYADESGNKLYPDNQPDVVATVAQEVEKETGSVEIPTEEAKPEPEKNSGKGKSTPPPATETSKESAAKDPEQTTLNLDKPAY